MASDASIKSFLGIRNAEPAKGYPPGSLADADNVVLDDAGNLHHRFGVGAPVAMAGCTDGFSVDHFGYALIVADGTLYSVWPSGEWRQIQSGLTDEVFQWAQSGQFVAMAGKSDALLIVDGIKALPLRIPAPLVTAVAGSGDLPPGVYQFTAHARHVATGVVGPAIPSLTISTIAPCSFQVYAEIPAGHEVDLFATAPGPGGTVERYIGTTTGAAITYDMTTQLLEPLHDAQIGTYPLPPHVRAVAVHKGSLWGVSWLQDLPGKTEDKSFVYRSEPGRFQMFRTFGDGFSVPGKVLGMASMADGLVIATDKAIYKLGMDEIEANGFSLPVQNRLVSYGAVPGYPMAKDQEGNVLIWTTRGQCIASPGEGIGNLFKDTDGSWKLSVPPGTSVVNGIINHDGLTLSVAFTDGKGEAFNKYTRG